MTPPIPAAEAIRGLAEALAEVRRWAQPCLCCDANIDDTDCTCGDFNEVADKVRVALAAFERRAPLRDDKAFLLALESAIRGRTNWYPEHGWIASVADAIDSALFGTAAEEGSREK